MSIRFRFLRLNIWSCSTYFVDLHQLEMPSLPRLLVLVNPFSGPGRALHIFQQSIVPVFAEAGLQYHLVVTGYGIWCICLWLMDKYDVHDGLVVELVIIGRLRI